MADVIDFNPDRHKPHFNFFALCLSCRHKWIATVPVDTSVFRLECPDCHVQDSFCSPIPDDWLAAWASLEVP